MTRQEEILGPHPVSHPVIGVWLDFEDKEPTENQCLRFLSEKHELGDAEMSPFSDLLIQYHYPDRAIQTMKKNLEKLGLPKFAQYYEQSRKMPNNLITQKGNAVEVLMTEYSLAAINKSDLTYAHRFRYNPNVDQSMKGDDMLIVDFSDTAHPVIYLGEAKYRNSVSKQVVDDVSQSLNKGKMPLSLTFLRDCAETNDAEYALLDDLLTKTLSDYDIRYIGFIAGDTNACKAVEKHWCSDNPRHLVMVLSMNDPEKFVVDSFNMATVKLQQKDDYDVKG